jgi:hypothetical protein
VARTAVSSANVAMVVVGEVADRPHITILFV